MVLSGEGEADVRSSTVSGMLREEMAPGPAMTLRAALWLALVAIAVVIWIGTIRAIGFSPATAGSDAWNYLAAGERLNAAHPLYALSPGDRAIQLLPPYWTVPLLAPPPIAVLWRPLALLGDSAMNLWAGAGLVITFATAAWLLVRGGLIVAGIIAIMAVALAEQAVAGNANGFLFLALVAVWILRARPALAGSLIAAAIAVKLTPALLLIWLVTARRWKLFAAAVAALAVIGVVSLVGAGVQNHLDWLASVPQAVPAPTSIAGMTGLPSAVVLVLSALAVLVASGLRDERVTFSVAVIAAALASPALYLGTIGIAAAAAAAWIAPATPVLPVLRRGPA